jgi:hypothetical protein
MAHGEVRRLGIVRAGEPLVQASDAGFMTIGVGLPELPSVPALASWTRLETSPGPGSSWVLRQAPGSPRYLPRAGELPRDAIPARPEVIGATLQKLAPFLGMDFRVRAIVTVRRADPALAGRVRTRGGP